MAHRTRITFDRIGRDHYPTPLDVDLPMTAADEIAEAVFVYVRPKVASSWFGVSYDAKKRSGSIEGGRFGTFTVSRAPKQEGI